VASPKKVAGRVILQERPVIIIRDELHTAEVKIRSKKFPGCEDMAFSIGGKSEAPRNPQSPGFAIVMEPINGLCAHALWYEQGTADQ
jgi:hypothetical protein